MRPPDQSYIPLHITNYGPSHVSLRLAHGINITHIFTFRVINTRVFATWTIKHTHNLAWAENQYISSLAYIALGQYDGPC